MACEAIVSIPSDRGFCNDIIQGNCLVTPTGFQSPLIGASVMTILWLCLCISVVNVSIPSDRGFCNDITTLQLQDIYKKFQSPLIGASVMTLVLCVGRHDQYLIVSIPSDRGFCNDQRTRTQPSFSSVGFNPL